MDEIREAEPVPFTRLRHHRAWDKVELALTEPYATAGQTTAERFLTRHECIALAAELHTFAERLPE